MSAADDLTMLGFLQQLGGQLGAWFYVIAGALACAEAAVMVGLVLPGETALVVAGFAARQGWIALWPMVAVAVGSAAVGDSVGYEVGRRLGPRLRSSRLGRLVGDDRWRRTDDFLRRYGGRAVLLGRFTAGLRALTPGMAGMAQMPYLRTFLPWPWLSSSSTSGGSAAGFVDDGKITASRYGEWPLTVTTSGRSRDTVEGMKEARPGEVGKD